MYVAEQTDSCETSHSGRMDVTEYSMKPAVQLIVTLAIFQQQSHRAVVRHIHTVEPADSSCIGQRN